MTTDDDRPQWMTPSARLFIIISVTGTIVFSIVLLVGSLINFYWGNPPHPSATVEAVFVGILVFIITNAAMVAWTTFGRPKEDIRRLLKKRHGLYRWLGTLTTSVLSAVIAELIILHLHR